MKSDAADSRAAFVARREAEIASPCSPYSIEFFKGRTNATRLIALLPRILAVPANQPLLAGLVGNSERYTALRYLAGPPISEDDLLTLIGEPVNKTVLLRNGDLSNRLVAFLRTALDKQRFPWVALSRAPTAIEFEAARISTAVTIASQRTQTGRRNEERNQLEGAVETVLNSLGFVKVMSPRGNKIHDVADLPEGGQYITHCNIGKHNADFVIRLFNSRVLAMECKASNTAINSRKRVTKETERDAGHWTEIFGNQVVTAAALRGVFDPELISHSQGAGLYIFWEHRLGDLVAFIDATRRQIPG